MAELVTIYAVSAEGIEELQAEILDGGCARKNGFLSASDDRYFWKNQYSLDRATALEMSRKKRAARIASLKRQIAKLEAIDNG